MIHQNLSSTTDPATAATQSHACLIYDDLAAYRSVAMNFIREGLSANEKCIFAIDHYTPQMIAEDFATAGLDLDAEQNRGRISIIHVPSIYQANGAFDPDETILAWQQQTQNALEEGFSALRVVGEATFALDGQRGENNLIYYENRINADLFPHHPFRSLCVYDKSLYPPRIIKAVIKAHPVLYYNDERLAENIYFVPPESHFASQNQRQEVDLWLTNARRHNANLQALRESEETFRLTFTSSPDAVNINRLENGLYVDINEGFTRLTGFTPEDVNGRTSIDIDIWADAADRRRLVAELRQNGYCDNLEAQFRRKDGSLTTALMSARVIRLKGVPHIISITRDISARKQAEAERERLLRAIEQTSELVVITDATGIIQYVNPGFETITGFPAAEAIGKTPQILNSGRQDAAFYRNLWETILLGNAWKGRVVNRRKDGTMFTAECSISPIKDNGGEVVSFVWISRDITKEIELENRFSQAQKMEAIGALAGGIAHDFNNLLFPILGMAEMMLEDNPEGSNNHESAEEIFKAAKRAGELVNQILSFSRQSDHRKTAVRIQQILKEVVKLTRATIPSNIEMVQAIQADCGMVMADPSQVHQVAMNLVTNAFHAVERKGGKISITLRTVSLGPDDSVGVLLEPGTYALMSIADDGHGIDPSIMGNIFEPYFTTKPQGKGTGLGLSVVYGIVKDHGGDIQVTSVVGEGTTFNVYLPLMKKEPLVKATDAMVPLAGGCEQVLLVDDEVAVLKLETQMLERLGYRVEPRSSSTEALNAFRAAPDRFDLVVTDLAMPNMTGDQLALKVMAIRPETRIIICTGFSERLDAEKARLIGIDGFLMKPIVKSQLARLVREVLDAPVTGPVSS